MPPAAAAPSPQPEREDAHEWFSFEDPDELRTWVFDVTFLLSRWSCIFGRGCPGINETPDVASEIGCCTHGAHFTGDEDIADTTRYVEQLTAADWQFKKIADRRGWLLTQRDGVRKTRVVNGACIFANRPGFGAMGAGCALHQAAIKHGAAITEWKPDVCWQAPLRQYDHVDEYGHVTSLVREWKRRDWGPGGADFHWWCTDTGDAFVGTTPVYVYLREELTAMVGEKAYAILADELDRRKRTKFLPHPALRRPSWKQGAAADVTLAADPSA